MIVGSTYLPLIISSNTAKASECSPGLQMDPVLNRCLTTAQTANIINAVKTCNGDKECYKDNARTALSKEEGVPDDSSQKKMFGDDLSKGSIFGGTLTSKLTVGAAALAVTASAYTLWSAKKAGVKCNSISTYAMLAGGASLGIGEVMSNMGHRGRLEDNNQEWKEYKAQTDTKTAEGSNMQGQAFEVLAKNEESMAKAAGQKKIFFAVATGAFGVSAVMSAFEWKKLSAAKAANKKADTSNITQKQILQAQNTKLVGLKTQLVAASANPTAAAAIQTKITELQGEIVKTKQTILQNNRAIANYLNVIKTTTCFQAENIRNCPNLVANLKKIEGREKQLTQPIVLPAGNEVAQLAALSEMEDPMSIPGCGGNNANPGGTTAPAGTGSIQNLLNPKEEVVAVYAVNNFLKPTKKEIAAITDAKSLPELLNAHDKVKYKYLPTLVTSKKEYRKAVNVDKDTHDFMLPIMKKYILEAFIPSAEADDQPISNYLRQALAAQKVYLAIEASQTKEGLLYTKKIQDKSAIEVVMNLLISPAYAQATAGGNCIYGGISTTRDRNKNCNRPTSSFCDGSKNANTFKCGPAFGSECIPYSTQGVRQTADCNAAFKEKYKTPEEQEAALKRAGYDPAKDSLLSYCDNPQGLGNDQQQKLACDEYKRSVKKPDPAPSPRTVEIDCGNSVKVKPPAKCPDAPVAEIDCGNNVKVKPPAKCPDVPKPKKMVEGCYDLSASNGIPDGNDADTIYKNNDSQCNRDAMSYLNSASCRMPGQESFTADKNAPLTGKPGEQKACKLEGEGLGAFIRNPRTRTVFSGLMAIWSGVLTKQAMKVEKDSKERAEAYKKVQANFKSANGALNTCGSADRNDPSKANCYCYTEEGQRNNNRGNSAVCQKLWAGLKITPGKYNGRAKDYNAKVCLAGSGQIDKSCACKSNNSCMKSGSGNFGGLPGSFSMGSNPLQQVDAIANGTFDPAKVNDGATLANANRALAIAGKLIKDEPGSKKSQKIGDKIGRLAVKRGGSMGVTSFGGSSSSAGSLSSNPAQAVRDLEDSFKAPEQAVGTYGGDGAEGLGTPEATEEPEFGLTAEGLAAQEGQIAEVMNQDLDYGGNDINNGSTSNIFEVLSNRYQRSGMRRLFDENGSTQADKPAADDIAQ